MWLSLFLHEYLYFLQVTQDVLNVKMSIYIQMHTAQTKVTGILKQQQPLCDVLFFHFIFTIYYGTRLNVQVVIFTFFLKLKHKFSRLD